MSEDYRERFWAKVDIRGRPDDCWPWTGSLAKKGYGSFKLNGAAVTASRLAYVLGNGKEPGALMVLHTCDNPPCCNPAHLYLGDVKQNSDDMMVRGRQKTVINDGGVKLTEAQVTEIKWFIAKSGYTNKEIAGMYGVSPRAIGKIKSGHHWKKVA